MSKKLSEEQKAENKAAAEKKKADAKAAKAAAKAARPKLVRKSAPFRKYSASPAGHFADSISAFQRRLIELKKKTGRWSETLTKAIDALTAPVEALRNEFETLAASDFKPKKGGTKRIPEFKPAEIVTVSTEALALLNKDFPSLTSEHTIVVASTVAEGDKAIPLCVRNPDGSQGQFLGRVSYKTLTKVVAPAATETDTSAAA